MTTDLTDEELAALERIFSPENGCGQIVGRLIAEVRRHRAHKCDDSGKCGECGGPTFPRTNCWHCSQ